MLGSKKWAFQKFGYTDPTITTENITISQQLQLPYKPPQEPNTYGFSDDAVSWEYRTLGCEYSYLSNEYTELTPFHCQVTFTSCENVLLPSQWRSDTCHHIKHVAVECCIQSF